MLDGGSDGSHKDNWRNCESEMGSYMARVRQGWGRPFLSGVGRDVIVRGSWMSTL